MTDRYFEALLPGSNCYERRSRPIEARRPVTHKSAFGRCRRHFVLETHANEITAVIRDFLTP
jgi:hypothetical protein